MSKTKKRKEATENSKLFMELNLNTSYLQDIKIKTDHESLVDKKYFTDQLTDISNSVNDLEKVKSGDKVLTMAQRFSTRLGKIKEVNPVNNLDTLRKAGMKELRISIKENDKGGYLQFGKSQKDSWNSLLARVSKIGTVLLHKKDIFTVEKNSKGKFQVFTQDKYINPEVLMFTDENKRGEKVANPKGDRKVSVSGDAMERIYSNEILGNKKPEKKKSEGATAGTINNVFGEMQNTFNYFLTKDPEQIVKNILEENFGTGATDIKDPSKVLLNHTSFCNLFNTILEVSKLLNTQHPDTNEQMTEALKVASGVYYHREEKTFKRTN
tara:strand:- start:1200 stop:2174 length:975 start_codon:yes stop_codon:yes gene_type:complete